MADDNSIGKATLMRKLKPNREKLQEKRLEKRRAVVDAVEKRRSEPVERRRARAHRRTLGQAEHVRLKGAAKHVQREWNRHRESKRLRTRETAVRALQRRTRIHLILKKFIHPKTPTPLTPPAAAL